MHDKPYFITVEGIEGAGKSTALHYLQNRLVEAGIDPLVTREPGGTPMAEDIRRVLLGTYTETVQPHTELFLVFACRSQHLAQVVRPALEQGRWVICDRFVDASYAYQGGGRGLPAAHLDALSSWVQGDVTPDLTLLLDVPFEVSAQRMELRGMKDRIEHEAAAFFNRVRQAYLDRAAQHPQRFRVIDGSVSLVEVQQQIAEALLDLKAELPRAYGARNDGHGEGEAQ